ncbi:MAG: BrnT family toxin [Zoogloea sp.]|nr:BrnT family toxin [Zoogloea sp.]
MRKHGVSLEAATGFEWESALTWPDERKDYGEARMGGIGYIGLRLYAVVFRRPPNHQPTQGQQQRGAPLCRNLNRERSFPLRKRMPPSLPRPRPTRTPCL